MESSVGIRSDLVSPREARRRERARQRLLKRPLILAVPELRAATVAWSIAGGIAVVLALALGQLFHLAPIEYAATGGALFLPPAASIAAVMLGRRTPTFMIYRNIFDRSPPAPEAVPREPPQRTMRRAAVGAVALGVGLIPPIALGLALSEAAMGRTRSRIPDHLPEEAVLVAGIYMLVSAGSAAVIRAWIAHWEGQRRRRVLCPPLHSGLIQEIYFAEDEEVTLPPARSSPGAGASTRRAAP